MGKSRDWTGRRGFIFLLNYSYLQISLGLEGASLFAPRRTAGIIFQH